MDNLLNAEYELSDGVSFDCSFELYASGTVWGNIAGDINNQTDLINLLNTKVDLTDFEELSQTVTNNYNELTGDIADLTTTVTNNYSTLSGQISDLTTTVNDNYTSLDNRLTTAEGSILDLTDTVNDNFTDLDDKITDNTDDITTIQNTINSYGDIVSYNAAYFATANQGALADTALQPNDNISELVNDVGYITSASLPTVNNATITIQKNGSSVGTFTLNQANNDTLNITVPTQASDIGAMPDTTTIEDLTTTAQLNALNSGATVTNIGQITTNQNNIADIRSLIPLQASTSNQLADKGFVNSSIATNTAYFIGTFNSVAELEAYSGTLTNNDYAFVATTDSAGNTLYDRYKYNADTQQWMFEYELNNSSFTAQQWASINSGITSGDVALIGTALQPNDNISELTNDMGYVTTIKGGTDINVVRHTSLLPNGYTQLEYIESTGTQYIDTGYKPSNTTKVKTRFSVQEPISFVFGSRNSTSGANQKRFGLHLSSLELGAHWLVQYANTNASISNYELNIVYDVEMSESGFYVDGTNIYSLPVTVFTGDYNMYLFANNTADTTTQYGSVKIYSFQIYDNNILIHDYIPCKNSSNVIGMYDIVTNTFFTNAGTGDFVAGLEPPTYYIMFSNESGYITSSALSGYATETWVGNQGYQTTSNLVTSISSSSTDAQYPSAKCVYDIVGDIESILHNINSGGNQ